MRAILNPRLVAQQNLSAEEVAKIEELHQVKYSLLQRMKRSKKPDTLRKLAADVTAVEFELQDAWHFPRDMNFHRFWELPHCSCPKMDNRERWGSGYAIHSQDCPIHGWEIKV